jgi:hypothetical protein
MKFFRLLPIFLVALPVAAQNHYYTTTFPATENPICQNSGSGCVWINGGQTGIDWGNIQTKTSLVFGVSEPSQYGDPSAVLQGTWTADQTVQATVYVGSAPSNCCHEVELRLRMTITPHSSTGYEINCSVVPSDQYMQVVRWNGALGSFTYVGWGNGYCANGDVLKATISGSTITVYKNGTQMIQTTDTTFTNGTPGLGFYDNADTNWSNFGFSNYTASDSAYTGSSQQPGAPTKLTGTVVQK